MTQLREAPTQNLDLSVARYFGPEKFPTYGGEDYGGYGSNLGLRLDCGGGFGQVYATRNDPRNIQMSPKVMF
jgi:hypothetical protein